MSALELNGQEMEQGHAMNVFISNPERKKKRTDADANDREIYVAGLSKFTTKEDLEKLFGSVCLSPNQVCYSTYRPAQYGRVKEVRMTVGSDGNCKGFAFVEFEQEV